MNSSTHQKSINRRNLMKGAAWATPVVLASATVPAYAASPESECPTITASIDRNMGREFLLVTISGRTKGLTISALKDSVLDYGSFPTIYWNLLAADPVPHQPRGAQAAFWIGPEKMDNYTFRLHIIPSPTNELGMSIDYGNGCPPIIYDGKDILIGGTI